MKVNITTDDGELIERINVNEYDLTKTWARVAFTQEVFNAIEVGQSIEARKAHTRFRAGQSVGFFGRPGTYATVREVIDSGATLLVDYEGGGRGAVASTDVCLVDDED